MLTIAVHHYLNAVRSAGITVRSIYGDSLWTRVYRESANQWACPAAAGWGACQTVNGAGV